MSDRTGARLRPRAPWIKSLTEHSITCRVGGISKRQGGRAARCKEKF